MLTTCAELELDEPVARCRSMRTKVPVLCLRSGHADAHVPEVWSPAQHP